jgi:hypothetical protein
MSDEEIKVQGFERVKVGGKPNIGSYLKKP